jgi:hypothetical protein
MESKSLIRSRPHGYDHGERHRYVVYTLPFNILVNFIITGEDQSLSPCFRHELYFSKLETSLGQGDLEYDYRCLVWGVMMAMMMVVVLVILVIVVVMLLLLLLLLLPPPPPPMPCRAGRRASPRPSRYFQNSRRSRQRWRGVDSRYFRSIIGDTNGSVVISMFHVTRHTSHATRHSSHAIRHTPYVTRHTLHVTRHTSHLSGHPLAAGLPQPANRRRQRNFPPSFSTTSMVSCKDTLFQSFDTQQSFLMLFL